MGRYPVDVTTILVGVLRHEPSPHLGRERPDPGLGMVRPVVELDHRIGIGRPQCSDDRLLHRL